MLMNTEWYRIFLHTARAGNLTKAASELHVTQPSVSYAIKQLEAGLQVKLFDRQSKGVQLTPEGAKLLEYVEKSFGLLDAGETQLRALRNLSAGELRIGASGPIMKHVLLSPLDRFRADYPDIRIKLSQGKTSDIRSRLKERVIDVGLVHLPFSDPELSVQPLLEVQDGFVVGDAFKPLSDRPIKASELIKIPLLLLTQGSSTRRFVDSWLASQGLQAEADIELSSIDMLIEFATRGYGAAFVTQSFVRGELDRGQLHLLKLDADIPKRSIGIAVRADHSLPLAARRFMELLASHPPT